MTESALNLAFKLVVRHDELKNVNYGVLHDDLVEVPGTRILFHKIGLKNLAYKHVKNSLVSALSPEIPGGRGGFLVYPILVVLDIYIRLKIAQPG